MSDLNKLLDEARAALDSLEEDRATYAEACEVEERTGSMDTEAYEVWEDSVMDTHVNSIADALSALVDAVEQGVAR